MATDPQDGDLLVPFEIAYIQGEYQAYYKAKRNNFFSSIQGFPELWRYYMMLEEIWLMEIVDLQIPDHSTKVFPLALYLNVHAKLRIAVELAFTGCLQEARSLLRDAIEFVAHAHHMLKDQILQTVWLNKNPAGEDQAFKDAYERNKKKGLFNGLGELHEKFGQLSETGSHATPSSLAGRLTFVDTPEGKLMTMSYTGWEQRDWALNLFSMLLTCFVIENQFFHDFEDRLSQDLVLMKMRQDFAVYKETLRQTLVARYQVQPPAHQP
jgi:hypothetical protein